MVFWSFRRKIKEEILRQGGGNPDFLIPAEVPEGEDVGMKEEAGQILPAIKEVPCYRVPKVGQMDADLMRPACMQGQGEEGALLPLGQNLE